MQLMFSTIGLCSVVGFILEFEYKKKQQCIGLFHISSKSKLLLLFLVPAVVERSYESWFLGAKKSKVSNKLSFLLVKAGLCFSSTLVLNWDSIGSSFFSAKASLLFEWRFFPALWGLFWPIEKKSWGWTVNCCFSGNRKLAIGICVFFWFCILLGNLGLN